MKSSALYLPPLQSIERPSSKQSGVALRHGAGDAITMNDSVRAGARPPDRAIEAHGFLGDQHSAALPLVRFVSATDPRWLATLDAIGRELVDDPLVYRYRSPDGLEGREGAFTAARSGTPSA
jgi:hypothetical protein